MTVTSTVATPAWPQDVAAFAKNQSVEHYLPVILEMTRRVFPTARRLEIQLESDWEIADQKYLVVEVEVADWDVSRATAARRQWMQSCDGLVPLLDQVHLSLAWSSSENERSRFHLACRFAGDAMKVYERNVLKTVTWHP